MASCAPDTFTNGLERIGSTEKYAIVQCKISSTNVYASPKGVYGGLGVFIHTKKKTISQLRALLTMVLDAVNGRRHRCGYESVSKTHRKTTVSVVGVGKTVDDLGSS